jgi:hypothetical protein
MKRYSNEQKQDIESQKYVRWFNNFDQTVKYWKKVYFNFFNKVPFQEQLIIQDKIK